MAYVKLGCAYEQIGNCEKALKNLTSSIQLELNVNHYIIRGDLHRRIGNHEKALKDYDKAIEMADSRNASPYAPPRRFTSAVG